MKKVTVLPCLGFYLVLFSGPENLRASSFNRYAIICIAVFNGLVESHSCWFCLDHNARPEESPGSKSGFSSIHGTRFQAWKKKKRQESGVAKDIADPRKAVAQTRRKSSGSTENCFRSKSSISCRTRVSHECNERLWTCSYTAVVLCCYLFSCVRMLGFQCGCLCVYALRICVCVCVGGGCMRYGQYFAL